jgi:Ni,Fe-hydrogenase III small subunit/NAD-dependent dihydropyrimidine dehydrogenase PreA subunit
MTIFKSIRTRISQGTQYIPDLKAARPSGFRGMPVIGKEPCAPDCTACRDACPTQAISLNPFTLDLGRCIFCDECVDVCPSEKISFTPDPRMGARYRKDLLIREGAEGPEIRSSPVFSGIFGRSLKMRQVSAGGCNGCELELNATSNVNFDLQRFGIEWVASPRHADALVLTGPLTRNMQDAVRIAWDAMPDPCFLVAVGACAISGGLYESSQSTNRSFLERVGPAIYVPGCPPHPLTFANAILDFLKADGKKYFKTGVGITKNE